jgi:hypothetical protein
MAHVEDKDLGFGDMIKAAAKVNGLELRNGILDNNLRYPKSDNAKGQLISRVASILGIHQAIGSGYDAQLAAIDAGMAQLLKDVHAGTTSPAERIHELIGAPIRDAQRAQLDGLITHRTGRMRESIRSTVFEGGRVGARGSAAAGKVAAGDNPRQPKAGQAVG